MSDTLISNIDLNEIDVI